MDWRCPSHMAFPLEQRRRLRYLWDDSRASDDFGYDSGWVLAAADGCSLRGQMALCVGLYEWVHWRLDGLHTRDEPLQVLEAAWCAVAQPHTLAFFELTRSEWQGPVLGPLWCAATWLRPALAEGDHALGEVADALQYLTRLAVHVSPDPGRIVAWLLHILPRLGRLSPPQPDDPFDDLFEARTDERRGPQVGRDMLDPASSPDPAAAPASGDELIRDARRRANPFVRAAGP